MARAGWCAGFRIPEAERKKPPGGGFLSGAGGIRTLVQTSNNNAFYMLSFCLVVGAQLTKNRPLRT